MKYPRLLAALRASKWAVTPPTLQAIRDALSSRMMGSPGAFSLGGRDDNEPQPPFQMIAPGVASVAMFGIIGRHLSQMEMDCGGCDLACVEENLTAALADTGVAAVILSIDSPGGTVNGVAEFSDKIGELSAISGKPVYAFIDGQGCSAAYWIACGCAGIACTPSSDVGSIGVYMALVDESENWAQEGFKLVLIKAGDFKASGISGSKVTAEQMALWQGEVDYIYGQFTGTVKANRGAITDATMQGQSFYGPLAVAAGLVDKLLPDCEAMAAEIAPRAQPLTMPVS